MKKIYQHIPSSPGVYIMRGPRGKILYIGKAGNLKRRVSSYFSRAHEYRIERLVKEIKKIDYQKTDTALEALMLEAVLIKKYQPPFNVRDKDDKSFLWIEITKEEFPRIILVRGKDRIKKNDRNQFGPFTSSSSLKKALGILRKIFPWNVHSSEKKLTRPCFNYEIGLCPGTCAGAISRAEYKKSIANLRLFFKGEKKTIIRSLKKEMTRLSKRQEFEKAQKIKRQLFALQHIQDIALITEPEPLLTGEPELRIEGYDISNISGTSAVGSMVVFVGEKPDNDEYRKFRIRTITQSDDVGMLKEVLRRRFKNNWPLPYCLLIDGGKPQVNAAKSVLRENGLDIPIVGIAKGPTRKKNEIIGGIPKGVTLKNLIHVRDEAHRFAITYHKAVRGRRFLPS